MKLILFLVLVVALTGCAHYSAELPNAGGPSDPESPEAAFPAAVPMLMAATNLTLIETNQPAAAGGGHGQHHDHGQKEKKP